MSKWKGTFSISLGGEDYILRPSFDAICEFYEKTEVTPQEAQEQLLNGTQGPKIIPACIWAGIYGERSLNGGKIPSFTVVGELMRKNGIKDYTVEAMKFITYSMSADDIIEKIESKVDEEEQKKS